MKKIDIELLPIDEAKEKLTASFLTKSHCIRCHCMVSKLEFKAYYIQDYPDYNVFILEHCPACSSVNLREYRHVHPSPFFNEEHYFDLTNHPSVHHPYAFNFAQFSDYVKNLSPRFVKIYAQAAMAEQMGLDEICGMSYRKAIEFLIKDYLIDLYKDDAESIAKEPLSKSIDRIDDKELQILSRACAWIGNDETHYVRKHEDYKVSDLKDFIDYALSVIQKKHTFNRAKNLLDS